MSKEEPWWFLPRLRLRVQSMERRSKWHPWCRRGSKEAVCKAAILLACSCSWSGRPGLPRLWLQQDHLRAIAQYSLRPRLWGHYGYYGRQRYPPHLWPHTRPPLSGDEDSGSPDEDRPPRGYQRNPKHFGWYPRFLHSF